MRLRRAANGLLEFSEVSFLLTVADDGEADPPVSSPPADGAAGDLATGGSPPPAGEAGDEAAGDGGAPSGGDPGGAPPEPKPSATEVPQWALRRINQLTAQLKSEREKNVRAARAEPPTGAPTPAASGYDDAEVERRANAKAAENEFLRRCSETEAAGRKEFGREWDTRVASLRQIFDPSSQGDVVAWNEMLAAAMETGSGTRVLHSLADNLDEATRIMNLPVLRKGVELARLAARLEADEPAGGLAGGEPSNAPRPIRAVGARGASHAAIAPDDATPTSEGRARSEALPIDVWMARRAAQVKERGLR